MTPPKAIRHTIIQMPNDNSLTDPVAPDLTKPQMAQPTFNEDELMAKISQFSNAPQTPPVQPAQPVQPPQPIQPEPVSPAPVASAPVAPVTPKPLPVEPQLVPATLPKDLTKNNNSKIITIGLGLVAVVAGASSFFFYLQSQELNSKLKTIQQTLDKQQLEPTVTPTQEPTPTPTVLEITPTVSPTSTPSGTVSVFGDLSKILTIAQGKYPDAQLLTVFVENAHNSATTIVKYWFRQTKTDKKYVYVKTEPGSDPVTYDQDVLVPDNNIPSLNTMGMNGQLGIDLEKAISVAASVCPSNFDCTNSVIDAQFIKANTTLWQITFKFNNRPFIVQVDSVTQGVLYKSNI